MTASELKFMDSVPSLLREIARQLNIANTLKTIELSTIAKDKNDLDMLNVVSEVAEKL